MKIIAFLTELDLLGQESKWLDIQRLKIKQSWLRYLFLAIYLSPLYSYYLLLFWVPFNFSFAYRHVKTITQQKFGHSSAQTPLSNRRSPAIGRKSITKKTNLSAAEKQKGSFDWRRLDSKPVSARWLAIRETSINKSVRCLRISLLFLQFLSYLYLLRPPDLQSHRTALEEEEVRV